MYKAFRSMALCALMATTCAIAAPQEPQNNSKPSNPGARIEDRLALTADQRTQFHEIVRNRHDQLTSIRNDASLSPAASKEKMKAARLDADAKIRAMLNPNQIAEYEQILKERHERAVRNKQTALPPQ